VKKEEKGGEKPVDPVGRLRSSGSERRWGKDEAIEGEGNGHDGEFWRRRRGRKRMKQMEG
jgi:hypothetical protein